MLSNNVTFPHNADMEKEVLSAMLIRDGEKIPAVLNILAADDFYFVKNKIIFNNIVNFYLKGFKFDALSIVEDMKKSGDFEKIGTDYLVECFNATYTNAYIERHAKIIKEKSELRHLMDTATRLYNSSQKGVTPIAEIVGNAQQDFSELSCLSDTSSRISNYENYFIQDFKAEIEIARKYSLRKTGFSNIDEQQIFSSGLYLIGATPAAGKTTFAWQMAEQLAKNGEICIFCSYEMSRLELFSKSIASELLQVVLVPIAGLLFLKKLPIIQSQSSESIFAMTVNTLRKKSLNNFCLTDFIYLLILQANKNHVRLTVCRIMT